MIGGSLNVVNLLNLPFFTSHGPSLYDATSKLKTFATADPVLLLSIIANTTIVGYVLSIIFSKAELPDVGYHHWLPGSTYYAGARFFVDSRRMVQEGYYKYPSRVFKIPQWSSWLWIVSGRQLIHELHYLPDDTLSLLHSAKDVLQIPYTMTTSIHSNPYHFHILRTKLTRYLDHLVVELMDEMTMAFDDIVGHAVAEDWVAFGALDSSLNIISRTFNRILVGTSICRDPAYNKISCDFSINTLVSATIINLFPSFLHPIVGRFATSFPSTLKSALVHLEPLIEQRKSMTEQFGEEWPDKPVDVLSWLMEAATGEEQTTEALATRVLVVNAATIQTSSLTFTQALINLAMYPEYVEPLRKEAEAAIRAHGWTKAGVSQMHRSDSFIKESMRLNSLGSLAFPRKAMKDFKLSDGTFIPQGAYVTAPFSVHWDEENYKDASRFNGYRFMKEGMVKTSEKFLSFGHGKHICPGRFVVSYLLKALTAHIVMNYDVKLAEEGSRPPDMWFGYVSSPNRTAKVMFRRRIETN